MQLRINASKTIARPQFRELIYQPYFDPENNRQYLGNPLLIDSQLYNAEARLEWYFAPEQRAVGFGLLQEDQEPDRKLHFGRRSDHQLRQCAQGDALWAPSSKR